MGKFVPIRVVSKDIPVGWVDECNETCLETFSSTPGEVGENFTGVVRGTMGAATGIRAVMGLMFVVMLTTLSSLVPLFVRGDKTPPLPGELRGTVIDVVVKGRDPATPDTIIPVSNVHTVCVQSAVLCGELEV